jgi:hypothetical protein
MRVSTKRLKNIKIQTQRIKTPSNGGFKQTPKLSRSYRKGAEKNFKSQTPVNFRAPVELRPATNGISIEPETMLTGKIFLAGKKCKHSNNSLINWNGRERNLSKLAVFSKKKLRLRFP